MKRGFRLGAPLMALLVLSILSLAFAGCLQTLPPEGQQTGPAEEEPSAITGGAVTEPKGEDSKPVLAGKDVFAKITVNEGELVKLDIDASDADGDSLTYTFSKPLNEAGEWQTRIGDAGEYTVKISASDGKLTTSKDILIIVKAVNAKPSIEPQKDITLSEGDKLVLSLRAIDPDGDILVWRYEPPLNPDGTWQTKAGDAGFYVMKATVSDGFASDSIEFNVNVVKRNMPPTLSIEREVVVDEGETIVLKPVVSDPEGKPVKVTFTGWMTTDTYTTENEDAGKHQVVVTASDGEMEESIVVWITVNNVNRAPEIHGLIVK